MASCFGNCHFVYVEAKLLFSFWQMLDCKNFEVFRLMRSKLCVLPRLYDRNQPEVTESVLRVGTWCSSVHPGLMTWLSHLCNRKGKSNESSHDVLTLFVCLWISHYHSRVKFGLFRARFRLSAIALPPPAHRVFKIYEEVFLTGKARMLKSEQINSWAIYHSFAYPRRENCYYSLVFRCFD